MRTAAIAAATAVVTTMAVGFFAQPVIDAYRPEASQVRSIGDAVATWLLGPEPMLWVLTVITVIFLVMVPRHNYIERRGRRLGRWMWCSVAGALIYRLVAGYPSGLPRKDLWKDPAPWLLLAGFAAWAATELVVWIIRIVRQFAKVELGDRDGRWILLQREGQDPGRASGAWSKVFRCTVPRHRAMHGNETCEHEIAAARQRSTTDRWLMAGDLPQEFKHPQSPGYDPHITRSTSEPDASPPPKSPARQPTPGSFQRHLRRVSRASAEAALRNLRDTQSPRASDESTELA